MKKEVNENNLHQFLGYDKDNAEKALQGKRLLSVINMMYILADVVNSYASDADDIMRQFHRELTHVHKYRLNKLQALTKKAAQQAAEIAAPMYQISIADTAVYDADFYYYLTMLMEDRLNACAGGTRQLLELLFNMPSQGLFDVEVEHFKYYGSMTGKEVNDGRN